MSNSTTEEVEAESSNIDLLLNNMTLNEFERGYLKAQAKLHGFDKVEIYVKFRPSESNPLYAHLRFYGDERGTDATGLYKSLCEEGMGYLENNGWSGDHDGTYFKMGVEANA